MSFRSRRLPAPASDPHPGGDSRTGRDPVGPVEPMSPGEETSTSSTLAADESLVELRCSVVVSRGDQVLLLHRRRNRVEEWVLPGGRPRPGEGMLSCARREVAEETGLVVNPDRCAFVADVIAPDGDRRRVELVFLARVAANNDDALVGEDGVEPAWVDLQQVRGLDLRPPVAGFLPSAVRGQAQTAPYLGNLWRPRDVDDHDRSRRTDQ